MQEANAILSVMRLQLFVHTYSRFNNVSCAVERQITMMLCVLPENRLVYRAKGTSSVRLRRLATQAERDIVLSSDICSRGKKLQINISLSGIRKLSRLHAGSIQSFPAEAFVPLAISSGVSTKRG